jgi:uncharacterized circularly permuted ATP-grasp superfamily protein/uncharacterized alpha-E superfamily protein
MESVPPTNLFASNSYHERGTNRTGGYDEMFGADGVVREPWVPLQRELNRLGSLELHRRMQQAAEQIANHGVTFNPYDLSEGASRPWSFDAIPLLLSPDQWRSIADGLEQRAHVLELTLRDLWGPQELIRAGIIPPYFLFAHPGFQPAYHGLTGPVGTHLYIYAADLARDSAGQLWVMGDRTRAPFGLGYVLENRLIAANLLLDAFQACRVQRLAGFFQALHHTLTQAAAGSNPSPHIVVWTKGPNSRSYFEDAYLARYLGYTLVQSDDLAVRKNQLMLKTLGGLVPVDVVWRRVNDEHCDPVELNSDTAAGVAGLLEVVRSGNVVVVNGIGSRVVESPVLSVWLPAIARFFSLGELKIPTIPTWWCQDVGAFDWVTSHLDELLIRPAFRIDNQPPIYPQELTLHEKQDLILRIRANPAAFIAQQRIERSTAPVWYADRVQHWPLALRGYVLAGQDGYRTLPGGLARVAFRQSLLDQSPTSGEKSQDVWVQGHQRSSTHSLLPSPTGPVILKRSGAELPSRVADAFFWLGRNIERAEFGARLMRVALLLLQNEREGVLDGSRVLRALAESGQIEPDLVVPGIRETLPHMTRSLPISLFSDHLPLGFRSSLDHVIRLSGSLRDRLSVDAWRILHRMDTLCSRREASEIPDVADSTELLDRLVSITAAFAGLVAENTTRTLGWKFLELGRRIERGQNTATFLDVMFGTPAEQVDLVLESAVQVLDSLMTYRLRYHSLWHPTAACDLLLNDHTNPRSLAFQLDLIEGHIGQLPNEANPAEIRVDQRLAVALKHSILMSDPAELMNIQGQERPLLRTLLARISEQLTELSRTISSKYLVHAPLQRHFAVARGESVSPAD